MKPAKILLAMTAAVAISAPAVVAEATSVSVHIGQPGYYGAIDIGGYPQPQVIYPEPVVIQPGVAVGEPVYYRVPPGHAKDWKHYCHKYHGCGRPAYFVQDTWYRKEYAPQYSKNHHHGHHQENHHDHD